MLNVFPICLYIRQSICWDEPIVSRSYEWNFDLRSCDILENIRKFPDSSAMLRRGRPVQIFDKVTDLE